MLARRCVPEPSNKEGRSVVEGSVLFYSSRLAPVMSGSVFEVHSRCSEWDGAIKRTTSRGRRRD